MGGNSKAVRDYECGWFDGAQWDGEGRRVGGYALSFRIVRVLRWGEDGGERREGYWSVSDGGLGDGAGADGGVGAGGTEPLTGWFEGQVSRDRPTGREKDCAA